MAKAGAGDCRYDDMTHATQTPWSDEERAMLRRLRANGLTLKACATMMGRSFHSVQRAMRRLDSRNPAPTARQPRLQQPRRVGLVSLPPLPSLGGSDEPR